MCRPRDRSTEPGQHAADRALRLGRWRGWRQHRTTILAVWLSVLIVSSLVFAPAVAAKPIDRGGPPDHAEKPDAPPGQEKKSADSTEPPGQEKQSSDSSEPPDHAEKSDAPPGLEKQSSEDPNTDTGANTTDTDDDSTGDDTTSDSDSTTDSDTSSTTTSDDGDEADGTVHSVTSSDEETDDAPEFESDGAELLGRISLESSATDDVELTFELDKDRLQAIDATLGSVTLYAYIDGEWVPIETQAIAETDSHYVFSANSPYVSEFAVGALRPSFELWTADVDDRTVTVGESVAVTTRFTNVGQADGVYEVALVVDGRVVERQHRTVASGGTRQATMHWTFDQPGTYRIEVNGVEAGTVTVTSDGATTGGAGVMGNLALWVFGESPSSLFQQVLAAGRYVATGPVLRFVAFVFV